MSDLKIVFSSQLELRSSWFPAYVMSHLAKCSSHPYGEQGIKYLLKGYLCCEAGGPTTRSTAQAPVASCRSVGKCCLRYYFSIQFLRPPPVSCCGQSRNMARRLIGTIFSSETRGIHPPPFPTIPAQSKRQFLNPL